eukprot:TRINITY_DN8499_c0_g1_i1.p1 TRINITY_DN8499_c0_g1~~TRINITY_DN8499_c0_g1_i1.p1  ORF type:complete len:557 (-),score=54.02 TRINITY_DN8499_c0_g1_i1:43-1692(-)
MPKTKDKKPRIGQRKTQKVCCWNETVFYDHPIIQYIWTYYLEIGGENDTAESPLGYSKGRRALTIGLAIFFEFTMALVITGYQAILPVLIRDGVYFNLCPESEIEVYTDSTGRSYEFCNTQKVRLNLMFSIAIGTQNLISPIMGIINEKKSPKLVSAMATVFGIAGWGFMALSSPTFDGYILGYIFLALSGNATIISCAHLVNLFPEQRALFVTFLTAAGQMSNGLMFLGSILYDYTSLGLREIFLIFGIIPILHIVLVLLQPPSTVLVMVAPPKERYIIDLSIGKKLLGKTQLWLLILWSVSCIVGTYFYLITLREQLLWILGDDDLVDKAANLYSILFLFCPMLSVPLTGFITNQFGTLVGLCVETFLMALWSVISMVPIFEVQLLSFVVYIVLRASFFGLLAHYTNVMFGPYFSRVLGLCLMLGGLFSYLNSFMQYLAIDVFNNEFIFLTIPLHVLTISTTGFLAMMVYFWRVKKTDIVIEDNYNSSEGSYSGEDPINLSPIQRNDSFDLRRVGISGNSRRVFNPNDPNAHLKSHFHRRATSAAIF